MPFRKTFKKLFKNNQGQSVTEYILILSVVVLIALKFKGVIGEKISNATDTIGGKIQSALDGDL